jgi:hypothetical protein
MPIGPRFRKKRPRNDLDDFLDEVDSYLFCVSRADRQCLHNDLKAHARDLTIDESYAHKFKGKYQINALQLRNEVGEPTIIAEMYISSVKKRMSSGMGSFLVFTTVMLLTTFLIGINQKRIDLWYTMAYLGGFSIIIGFFVKLWKNFDRYHIILPYLVFMFLILSIPIAITIANDLTKYYDMEVWTSSISIYRSLLIIDFIIISIIALHTALKHLQVYQKGKEVLI